MTFDVVAELTIASIASVVEHVPTHGWRRHGAVHQILGDIEIKVGHQSSRSGGFFAEITVHAQEDFNT